MMSEKRKLAQILVVKITNSIIKVIYTRVKEKDKHRAVFDNC